MADVFTSLAPIEVSRVRTVYNNVNVVRWSVLLNCLWRPSHSMVSNRIVLSVAVILREAYMQERSLA